MWKAILGALLLIGTLTRPGFGFTSGTGGEIIGSNIASIVMIVAGLILIYSWHRSQKPTA